jgi:lysophospholipase L1-like esterase
VTSQFTFGGFPVTRVPNHLKPRCLDAHPDIVVVQFASSDLVVPLRRHRLQSSSPVHRKVSATTPTLFDRFRWQLQGLIGNALRLSPVTPPDVYLQTMEQLARTLQEHEILPVVMSPFVFGGKRSDRIARDCAGLLQQRLTQLSKAIYVDAYSALDQHPRSKMLLSDGSHLSLEGQLVVANALFPRLMNIVDNQAWFLKNPSQEGSRLF